MLMRCRLDGLNKNMSDFDITFYGREFNSLCRSFETPTLNYPDGILSFILYSLLLFFYFFQDSSSSSSSFFPPSQAAYRLISYLQLTNTYIYDL